MAAATLTYADVVQNVESNGERSVEATVAFSTPGTDTYTTNGVPVTLADIGLKTLREAWVRVTPNTKIATPYTLATWVTSVTTATVAPQVDIGTNGTPEAPLLVLYLGSSSNEHGTGAIAASNTFRVKFVGT